MTASLRSLLSAFAYCTDKGFYFYEIFYPWRAFNATRRIDSVWMCISNGIADV